MSEIRTPRRPLSAATVPTNIPRDLTRLIGRAREIETMRALLLREDVNLVTLTGLGGAGKTTLAIHVTGTLIGSFAGGVFFINLASITKSEMIPMEIGRVLKVEQSAKKNVLENLTDLLSNRKILLLLDNFEHLMSGRSTVNELLQSCPLLKILVTSREPLRLRAEQVFPLGPLASRFAVELFTVRAQSLNPAFSITRPEAGSVAELCRRLDGIPLAIELAALRTKIFTPRVMLARLQADLGASTPILDLLADGAKDLPPRQQTLRNTIAWSYGLLQEEEQRFFAPPLSFLPASILRCSPD